jgi:hypothetical protein
MADEPQFTVRDRRRSEGDPNPPADVPPATSPTHRPASQSADAPPSAPPSFSELILGLGTSALVALGVNPAAGEAGILSPQAVPPPSQPADLVQARHLIDVLGLLEQKTTGNLTPEEQQLMQQLLYTLRLKFVEQGRSGGPANPGEHT